MTVTPEPEPRTPAPTGRRRRGLVARVWIACLGGALAAAAGLGTVMSALWVSPQVTDPRALVVAVGGAAALGLVVAALLALWLSRGLSVGLRHLERGLDAGHLPESAGAIPQWGELDGVTARARAILTSHRQLARTASDFQLTRLEVTRLSEAVERWLASERWEPMTPQAGILVPLADALNRGFLRHDEVGAQNREAARLVREELMQAVGEARASAESAEHGFVEATALLTTVREISRLSQELQQTALGARGATQAPAQERWRDRAAQTLEELIGVSGESVEHLGNGLLKVQEIATQVQLLSNRATLIALNAVVSTGRPAPRDSADPWAAELKQLARDVRDATERVAKLSSDIEQDVRAANERMREVREHTLSRLGDVGGPEVAPAAEPVAGDVRRLSDRLREMVQDAARKGERLSEAGERASRSAERLMRRLDDGSRDMEGLLVRLSPPAQSSGISPSSQRLTLIERERAAGEKIVRRTPREERP